MPDCYADTTDGAGRTLHGAARLHVALARMDGEPLTTRGWTYNNLVDGIIGLGPGNDIDRMIDCLFHTLDAITEIDARAVSYLHDLSRIK